MSTSDRMVIAEAAGASALVVGLVALLSPNDVWLRGFGLHPMWLPVIVMSARYATRGFLPALIFTAGGLLLLGLGFEHSAEGFAQRTRSSSDLLALATAMLVAWIAMLHESRISRAVDKLTDATEAQRHAEENVHALHASLGYLRSRHDRLDISLSLWRHLASRLESGNAVDASRAVLELCEIRAGARAGVVELRDGERLSTLASRGQWSATAQRPRDLSSDASVRAAIQSKHVTPALPGTTEDDSDVAIPVTDESTGAVIGVIALRGVSPGCMRAAELRDLGVIAQWLAPALEKQLRKQFGKAIGQLQERSASKNR